MVTLPPLATMEGKEFTVIAVLAVRTQPAALIPVTVYVAVAVPENVTVAPVDALRPADGDHE